MKIFLVLLAFFHFSLFAQSNFDFEFDYAQFGYDSTSNYVEFYYSFNQASLKPEIKDSQNNLEALLKVFIKNTETGDTVVYNQWIVKHQVDTSLNNNQLLIGTLGFVIPAGNFNCEIIGSDTHNLVMKRTINEQIKIIPFLNGTLNISDIQLASKMVQGSENTSSIFYKNTYEVIPNPNVVFGQSQPALFYYAEVYNVQSPSIKSSQIKMTQMLYNSRGKLIKEKNKYFAKNTSTRVEVGSQILTSYPSDTYTLVIALIDSAANTGVSTAKKFFIYNPGVAITDTFETSTTSVLSSTFGSMSEEELDDLFNKSKYLASNNEIDKFKKLSNIDGKREFMFEFWKSKDESSSSQTNDFYRQYLLRIEVCNDRYTSMGKAGWKTDRGRIFLLYGEPSEIERYPNQLETRPYEIWHYNELEGGVYFVFADITGFSDYMLLTSTKRGELRDDNWSRRIVIQ